MEHRPSRGIAPTMASSSFSKSMLSMRSASSMTRHLQVRREKPFVFSKWSTRRPGVATTTCGSFASASACAAISTPPTTQTHRRPMAAPKASKTSWICTASSRVGASATPKSRLGFSRSLWRMGRPNAPVFPLPVSARPMTSRPLNATGIAAFWIRVGFAQPSSPTASTSAACRPSADHAGLPVSAPSSAAAGSSSSSASSAAAAAASSSASETSARAAGAARAFFPSGAAGASAALRFFAAWRASS
mmetsp:Transcript_22852/g.73891  ORF Transcript_22852/g.73891 Transcript_22852/m.73891 type:complete len:247 (-) Transcript_22852:36-776(-)